MRLVFLVFVPVMISCSVFDPALLENARADADVGMPMREMGVSRDMGDEGVPPDVHPSCFEGSLDIPERPSVEDDGSDDEIVLGLHNLLLDQGGRIWEGIGRNLDSVCTGSPDFVASCEPGGDRPVADGEGGIDNAVGGELIRVIEIGVGDRIDLAQIAQDSSQAGTGAVVLQVRGWNGESEDATVEVVQSQSVYGINGTMDEADPAEHDLVDFEAFMPGTMERMPLPDWDGFDWLFQRTDSFLSNGEPVAADLGAYVTGGVLVVRLPDNVSFDFASAVRGISVELTDAHVRVGIHESAPNFGKAQLSGRWRVARILAAAETVGICEDLPTYTVVVQSLTNIADVMSDPSLDGRGRDCNALSIGVEWDVTPARLGPRVVGGEPPNACDM